MPLRRLALITTAAGLAFAVGCNQPLDTAEDTGSETAELADGEGGDVEDAPRKRFKKGKWGKAKGMLFKKALKLDDLSDAQRTTIEGLIADMKGDFDKEAHSAFRTALAEQVRAGAIADDFVDDHVDAMSDKMSARKEKYTDALQTLHSTLTPEQRTALVESMDRKRGKDAKRGKHAKHAKKGKHGKHAKKGKHGKDMKFLRGLNLTDEQKEQLRDARAEQKSERPSRDEMKAKRSAMRERHKAMLAAFATNDFDASAYAKGEMSARMEAMLNKKVEGLRTLISILDAEQRNTLADRIEKGFDKAGHKGKRGRGLRR